MVSSSPKEPALSTTTATFAEPALATAKLRCSWTTMNGTWKANCTVELKIWLVEFFYEILKGIFSDFFIRDF